MDETAPVQRASNARMYAVSAEVEAAWRQLFEEVGREAGVGLSYLPYPAPRPLEDLWRRPDLGCAFMCGFPLAARLADVVALAAPVPAAAWATGRPLYRTDFVVRADSDLESLRDTFGHAIGWTAEHSHSGFNAPRHHLLGLRGAETATLYADSVGPLVTPWAVLDAVAERRIAVGPLDSYWHDLLRRHRPDLAGAVRVVDSTALAPMPALVAARTTPDRDIAALRASLVETATRPWFPPLAETLCLSGFAAVEVDTYSVTLRWAAEAEAAGYPAPT